jgi:hypothetical protein
VAINQKIKNIGLPGMVLGLSGLSMSILTLTTRTIAAIKISRIAFGAGYFISAFVHINLVVELKRKKVILETIFVLSPSPNSLKNFEK